MEAALLPCALVHRLAFFRGHVHGADVEPFDVEEAARWCVATAKDVRIVLLGLGHLTLTEAALLHRQCRHRRALEHGELSGHFARLLNDLHTARPGPDDRHSLAGQAESFLRPQGGVMALTREPFEAG